MPVCACKHYSAHAGYLWLEVAAGHLAWGLVGGLGSLQSDPPTWLRRAWPQRQLRMHCQLGRQSAGCTKPACVAGARSMSGHSCMHVCIVVLQQISGSSSNDGMSPQQLQMVHLWMSLRRCANACAAPPSVCATSLWATTTLAKRSGARAVWIHGLESDIISLNRSMRLCAASVRSWLDPCCGGGQERSLSWAGPPPAATAACPRQPAAAFERAAGGSGTRLSASLERSGTAVKWHILTEGRGHQVSAPRGDITVVL